MKYNASYYKMFHIEREDIDYEVTLTSFKDQVHNKNMFIDQFTYHLTNICKSNLKSDKIIIEIAKFSRKFIQESGKIIQELQGYLQELKLDFLHELIFKIFKVLIIAFNKLSQKFVITLNDLKKSNDKTANNSQCDQHDVKNAKDQHKQIQYFDFIIRNLEQQQTKLEERKKIMQKEIFAQNVSFSSITASDAVNQLQELNKNLQKIIINSQKVSGQNVLYRYQQLSNYILSLRKPEQLKDEFCNKITANMKDKFILTMEKLMKQFYNRVKQQQRQLVLQQIQKAKPILVSRLMQTQPDLKIKQLQILNKQKKLLGIQIENYKKQIAYYDKQMERWKERIRQEKQMSANLQKKIDVADDSIKKKINDMLKMRTDYENTLSQKNQIIQNLTKKNQQFESLINQNFDHQNNSNLLKHEQPKQQNSMQMADNHSTTAKNKTIFRNRLSMAYQFENQLKQKRKENVQLRKCLQKLLEKFGQLNNTKQQKINEIITNLKNGVFGEKTKQFLSLIQQQIEENYENKDFDQLKSLQIISPKEQEKIQQKIQNAYKLNNFNLKPLKHSQKSQANERVNYSMMPHVNRNSKLEKLKREFIEKISLKKKTYDPRLKKNYFVNQTYDSTIDANYDPNNFSIDGDIAQQASQPKNKNTSNSKPMFSHKDITFQQFKICKIDKKPQKIRKKHNTVQNQLFNKSKQSGNKMYRNVFTNAQNFNIETQQITQRHNAKIEKKDLFIKQFIQTVLKQYGEKKGSKFIQQMIKNEIVEFNNRTIKIEAYNEQSQMNQFIVRPLR